MGFAGHNRKPKPRMWLHPVCSVCGTQHVCLTVVVAVRPVRTVSYCEKHRDQADLRAATAMLPRRGCESA